MGIYPCLTYRDIATAIDWLNDAFGIDGHVLSTGDPGEPVHHAILTFGDAKILVESERPEELHGSHCGQGWLLRDRPGRRQPLPAGAGGRSKRPQPTAYVRRRSPRLQHQRSRRQPVDLRHGDALTSNAGSAQPVRVADGGCRRRRRPPCSSLPARSRAPVRPFAYQATARAYRATARASRSRPSVVPAPASHLYAIDPPRLHSMHRRTYRA